MFPFQARGRGRVRTLGWMILALGLGGAPPTGALAPIDVENALWYQRSGYVPPAPAARTPLPQILPTPPSPPGPYRAYLPLILRAPVPEFRALWVTRFDWTRTDGTPARPEALVAIAEGAAAARFNVLLFQVRGTGDAYYTPGHEPWAARLTGTVTRTTGISPGFDPLRILLDAAHARGLQVHAYVNVYPTWLCGVGAPPDGLNPPHPFWTFSRTNGRSWSAWRAHDSSGNPMNLMTCSSYLWATPAWPGVRDQVVRVVQDLMVRYPLDGVHLDLVRYPGRDYSYDPFTPSFSDPAARAEWQREQVNALVQEVRAAVKGIRPHAWVTAAVWGVYQNRWGWPGFTSGYSDYYQDSVRWLREGWVDALMPMIYPAAPSANCPDTTVWTLERFRTLVADFQARAPGRYVFPGIHGGYACFQDVRDRIETARSLGARGMAIFAYGPAQMRGYWDEFAAQVYPAPAPVPPPP
ncbi:family 10 glycosylhydrolase [Thermoflexus sp.]|uniref:glycoside hydrolase family 10 protein n=1 Tax=Thermoflexus sp. TaxID=1969742 RepID=UPI0026287B02|nr:family 10 glycosylhydrolase [Thermoflexus sp.]MCX7690598.1 family 10 glycosylhydrolase [Thermoflexus sp.]